MDGRARIRWLSAALVLLLCIGGALTAAHGHLGSGDDARTCAICLAARARSTTPVRPAPLPAPRCVTFVIPVEPIAEPVPARPPLDTAPKHGPPARA